MQHRHSARDVAALIAAVCLALVWACAPDRVAAPNDNGTMVLDDAIDLDTVAVAPRSRRISVVLRDRKGMPIRALRVDWQARDHGTIKPPFSITDDAGRADAEWAFGPDTGQHKASARAKGFGEITLTARAAVVVSPLTLSELRPLQLLTYDGSGQTVHPDFVNVDAPAFARKFLALTPYQAGDASFENPTLYASTDMLRWRVPAGAPNPLVRPDASYLSDPDIVYDPALAELMLYYRQVGASNSIYLIRSRDAVRWTEPVRVVRAPNHEVVSPSIVRRAANDWLMWAVNAHSGCSDVTADLEIRHSTNGVDWDMPSPVTLVQPGFAPWHVEVQWIPSRSEYWAVYPVKTASTCATKALYLATSKDGITWKTYPSPVLSRGETYALADIVYRSTFAYDAATDVVTFWYSGARHNDTFYEWSTVVQRRTRAELFSRISAPFLATMIGPRREPPRLMDPP